MARALYWLVEHVDETFLHHRYGWLCALQDKFSPHGPHKPRALPYIVLTLIAVTLLCVVSKE